MRGAGLGFRPAVFSVLGFGFQVWVPLRGGGGAVGGVGVEGGWWCSAWHINCLWEDKLEDKFSKEKYQDNTQNQ